MKELKNKCLFIGKLGKDPEMRYTPSGNALTQFSIAVDMRKQGKDGEKGTSETTWVTITAWGKLAEACNNLLKKGAMDAVDTYMSTNTYEKDGVTHYASNFTLRSMDILVWGKRDGEDDDYFDTTATGAVSGGGLDDLPF